MNSQLITVKAHKTEPEILGYKHLSPAEYSYDMQHAVKMFYGYVEFDELAEALMVTAESLQKAARAFGMLSEAHAHITAQEIERAMRLIRQGTSANKVALLYGLEYNPDRELLETHYNDLTKQGELF